MAILTRTLGVLADETNDTRALLQVDYDNVAMRLTMVRVVNETTKSVFVTAKRASGGGQTYSRTVAAGRTVEQAIPGGAAARLGIVIDERGRLSGVDYQFGFGAAG